MRWRNVNLTFNITIKLMSSLTVVRMNNVLVVRGWWCKHVIPFHKHGYQPAAVVILQIGVQMFTCLSFRLLPTLFILNYSEPG